MGVDFGIIGSEYPFTPKKISIGPHTMSYLDEGPRTSRAIVMLHGNPTWSFYYRKLVLGLRENYRVIAPDHMGCGLSDKPQDYDYSLKTHIANLTKLLDELKISEITLMVHDWGGAIGMGYAVENPDKIKSLVIFNSAAFLSDFIPLRINVCRIPVAGEALIRGLNAFVLGAVTLGMGTAKPERFVKEVAHGYTAPYDSWDSRVAIARFVEDIPMKPEHRSWGLVKSIGEKLAVFEKTPALAIWGMKDFCFNQSFLEEWLRKLRNVEAHMIKDAGHFVVEDAYEKIIPMTKAFLERTG